ncbi:MAG TPA: hypothetical protein VJC03_01250, partial [bacterium]|nr:hypothetical protein [bacterium]
LSSWEDMKAAAKTIRKKFCKKGEYPMTNPDPGGAVSSRDVLPCIWNRGGEFLSGDFTRSGIHKEEAVEGIEEYLSLFSEGLMPLMGIGNTCGACSGKFGGSLMFSRRRTPFAGKAGVKRSLYGTMPLPVKNPLISVYSLAVLKDARQKKEGLRILEWFSKPEIHLRYARLIDAFPCLNSWKPDVSSEAEKVYYENLSRTRAVPNITVSGTYERLLDAVLWKAAREMMKRSYSRDYLMQKLILLQAEMDYLLSLYGDR